MKALLGGIGVDVVKTCANFHSARGEHQKVSSPFVSSTKGEHLEKCNDYLCKSFIIQDANVHFFPHDTQYRVIKFHEIFF
jgi:hypothetical protein